MPVLIRHLWQLKNVVFQHWCLICPVLFHENISTHRLGSGKKSFIEGPVGEVALVDLEPDGMFTLAFLLRSMSNVT